MPTHPLKGNFDRRVFGNMYDERCIALNHVELGTLVLTGIEGGQLKNGLRVQCFPVF
jgi:hypothetical protein